METSIQNLTSNDEVKSILPNTMYVLSSIDRLGKAGAFLSVIIIVAGFVIYASLKCSDLAEIYNTHLYQYQYIISGAFLQSTAPAFTLFIFHTVVLFRLYLHFPDF